MSDISAEKTKLTGIMESMEKSLEERDDEIHGLKTEASLNNDV